MSLDPLSIDIVIIPVMTIIYCSSVLDSIHEVLSHNSLRQPMPSTHKPVFCPFDIILYVLGIIIPPLIIQDYRLVKSLTFF